jgi:hypothetical protein
MLFNETLHLQKLLNAKWDKRTIMQDLKCKTAIEETEEEEDEEINYIDIHNMYLY